MSRDNCNILGEVEVRALVDTLDKTLTETDAETHWEKSRFLHRLTP